MVDGWDIPRFALWVELSYVEFEWSSALFMRFIL
jgi:hypothetical protein